MAVTIGAYLGPYEILSLLGSGGMGEVYRARDTKLGREVALKVLPDAFSMDSDRLARFKREAQLLASLNHRNIAAIYGFEEWDGVRALVLELVEGQSLADRIDRAPIPTDEVLLLARQIAEALEAAHEQGIIHRDLKPANVKVRADGVVKVLDFGLAKAIEPAGATAASLSLSPTITTPAITQTGILLGTATYMAPEQARGKVVDKRADIWAFGVVVFEMLTARRAFDGETISDVLAKVIEREPDWSALPASAPVHLRELLRRCLKKEPKTRLRDIGEARIQIEDLLSGAPTDVNASQSSPRDSRVSRRQMATIALATLATGAFTATFVTWSLMRAAPFRRPNTARLTVMMPGAQRFTSGGNYRDLVLSPDGARIVYIANGQLMVRSLDRLDAQPLSGVTGARFPFVSPDGEWIGFFDGLDLKKMPIAGGAPSLVCRLLGNPRGASWGSDNSIVFAAGTVRGLRSVPAGGGEPRVLTTPDTAHGERDHVLPSLLPGGRAVLFTILTINPGDEAVAVLDLDTGQHKTLMHGGTAAEYVEPGYLLYVAGGALRAVRFDASRLEVVGDPLPVVDRVMTVGGGAANFSVASNGALVYVPGDAGSQAGPPRSLVWVDRQGREEAIPVPTRTYVYPRLSPDGTRVALNIQGDDQAYDIWIWNLARKNLMPMTFGAGQNQYPVWTPDGRRVVFSRSGTISWQAADNTGTVEQLTSGSTTPHFPNSISADGKSLVFTETFPGTGRDISVLSLDSFSTSSSASTPRTKPLIQTPSIESNGEIAPDGRWLAYQSSEAGQDEIYVRPFPKVDDGKWRISTAGGTRPLWARNGRELFYIDVGGYLTAVPVETTAAFRYGNPARVLSTKYFSGLGGLAQAGRTYDVSLDGRRFLMIKDNVTSDQLPASMVVVLNWAEELKARMATK